LLQQIPTVLKVGGPLPHIFLPIILDLSAESKQQLQVCNHNIPDKATGNRPILLKDIHHIHRNRTHTASRLLSMVTAGPRQVILPSNNLSMGLLQDSRRMVLRPHMADSRANMAVHSPHTVSSHSTDNLVDHLADLDISTKPVRPHHLHQATFPDRPHRWTCLAKPTRSAQQ